MRSKGLDVFCMLWNSLPHVFIIPHLHTVAILVIESSWSLFLCGLRAYGLRPKVRLLVFMIYNVLTQADVTEKDLVTVFATAPEWSYSSHKVVFSPKGLSAVKCVWLQPIYAFHEAMQSSHVWCVPCEDVLQHRELCLTCTHGTWPKPGTWWGTFPTCVIFLQR